MKIGYIYLLVEKITWNLRHKNDVMIDEEFLGPINEQLHTVSILFWNNIILISTPDK